MRNKVQVFTLDPSGLVYGPVADSCKKNVNEHSGSTKHGEFLEYLRNYVLLKDYNP